MRVWQQWIFNFSSKDSSDMRKGSVAKKVGIRIEIEFKPCDDGLHEKRIDENPIFAHHHEIVSLP